MFAFNIHVHELHIPDGNTPQHFAESYIGRESHDNIQEASVRAVDHGKSSFSRPTPLPRPTERQSSSEEEIHREPSSLTASEYERMCGVSEREKERE